MKATPAYWEDFYSRSSVTDIPSQFAVFVAGEFPDSKFVVDIGCGNGRDANFFVRQGKFVLAIDQSERAIEKINENVPADFLRAFVSSIEAEDLPSKIAQTLESMHCPTGGILYARFFLHAIDNQQERAFFELASKLASQSIDAVALEFRTARDKNLAKTTAMHFRRYIDPLTLMAKASKWNFYADYFVEGFGFAKFGIDDPHIARIILRSGEAQEG